MCGLFLTGKVSCLFPAVTVLVCLRSLVFVAPWSLEAAHTAITCDFIQSGVHTTPLAAMFHLSCDLCHVCDWLWQLSHCTRAAHLCDKVQMHAMKSNLFDLSAIFIARNKNCTRSCRTRCNHMGF